MHSKKRAWVGLAMETLSKFSYLEHLELKRCIQFYRFFALLCNFNTCHILDILSIGKHHIVQNGKAWLVKNSCQIRAGALRMPPVKNFNNDPQLHVSGPLLPKITVWQAPVSSGLDFLNMNFFWVSSRQCITDF